MQPENTKLKYKTPIKLVILELIGGIMLGIGLAHNMGSVNLIPQYLQFQNYQWILIVMGALCFVPELILMFKFFKSQTKA